MRRNNNILRKHLQRYTFQHLQHNRLQHCSSSIRSYRDSGIAQRTNLLCRGLAAVLVAAYDCNGSFQHNSHGVRLTVTIAVEQSYKLGTARPVSKCHAQQQMFWHFPSSSSHCNTNIFGNGLWKSWRLKAGGERKDQWQKIYQRARWWNDARIKKKFADGGHGISWELLHAAWMCRRSIEAASSKFEFLKLQLQLLLQLLLLYTELKSTLAHFCNLVAKIVFLCQRNLPVFL